MRRWSQQSVAEYALVRRYEEERLSERDRLNEYVMTGLRCVEGIDLDYVCVRFGKGHCERIKRGVEPWINSGDVIANGSRIAVDAERFLISDAVIESLFEV